MLAAEKGGEGGVGVTIVAPGPTELRSEQTGRLDALVIPLQVDGREKVGKGGRGGG